MLRQRLLAAVVVRGGQAVQSFSYKKWLPLGNVSCIIQNLDRWGADGIVVLHSDRENNGPDLNLLRQISSLQLSTPLTYGGGIRSAKQGLEAIQAGAERIILDRSLDGPLDDIIELSSAVGRQALIAAVPVIKNQLGHTERWQYWNNQSVMINDWLRDANWSEYVSEILIIDAESEGSCKGANVSFVEEFKHLKMPLLVFGGLHRSIDIAKQLSQPEVVAAVIGNSLNYQENSIYSLKKELTAFPLRPHSLSN